MIPRLQLSPGKLIVFEGLDATGKSTQLARLQAAASGTMPNQQGPGMFVNPPLFTHQPSGGNAVGEAVYKVTESGDIASSWARQFLHLASHAEHYARTILPALNQGQSVFMDRCWWSTFAYGFYGGGLWQQMDAQMFLSIAQIPTRGKKPDLVLLFMEPFKEDDHNTIDVVEGYRYLEAYHNARTDLCDVACLHAGTEEQVSQEIVHLLADKGFLEPA